MLVLQGCANHAGKLIDLAEQRGLQVGKVRTASFDLLVASNAASANRRAPDQDGVLRIYLEGDGSPWKHRIFILADPTPRYPLMLRLMSLDKRSAVYLGRPCYNGTHNDPGCDFSLWTSGRYSNAVIQSMASGIRAIMKRRDATELWLIGHSGGGALAMLLAAEIPQVSRVVTLAGNLNVEAWTDHHGYTPLFSSRNPATVPPLRDDVWQWHLVGSQDGVIPPQLTKPFIARQSNANGFEFSSFNHGCCWERIWPTVLRVLDSGKPSLMPGAQFKTQAVP